MLTAGESLSPQYALFFDRSERGIIMSSVKVSELLKHATENHYGVPPSYQLHHYSARHSGGGSGAGACDRPVTGHLSHIAFMANDPGQESLRSHSIQRPMRLLSAASRDGFPSVMVDGSALPYEENVALTSQAAGPPGYLGVDVEAELGHVGGSESGGHDQRRFLHRSGSGCPVVETQAAAPALRWAMPTAIIFGTNLNRISDPVRSVRRFP